MTGGGIGPGCTTWRKEFCQPLLTLLHPLDFGCALQIELFDSLLYKSFSGSWLPKEALRTHSAPSSTPQPRHPALVPGNSPWRQLLVPTSPLCRGLLPFWRRGPRAEALSCALARSRAASISVWADVSSGPELPELQPNFGSSLILFIDRLCSNDHCKCADQDRWLLLVDRLHRLACPSLSFGPLFRRRSWSANNLVPT